QLEPSTHIFNRPIRFSFLPDPESENPAGVVKFNRCGQIRVITGTSLTARSANGHSDSLAPRAKSELRRYIEMYFGCGLRHTPAKEHVGLFSGSRDQKRCLFKRLQGCRQDGLPEYSFRFPCSIS